MRKVLLGIEEVLKYNRSMEIEIPDEMDEDELNEILDSVQIKADAANDIPYLLERLSKGIEVTVDPDSDMSSPWDTEVEIDDLEFLD